MNQRGAHCQQTSLLVADFQLCSKLLHNCRHSEAAIRAETTKGLLLQCFYIAAKLGDDLLQILHARQLFTDSCRQFSCHSVGRDPDWRRNVLQGILDDGSAVGFAEQKANRRRIRAGAEETIDGGEVEVQFARPFRFELPRLELDNKVAVQPKVIEEQVDIEGPPKTLASRRPLPLSKELATALEQWRKKTAFPKPGDWIFASPQALGKKPYWPDAVLKRHVRPAAKRAGITKIIGWHSFRRTLATLLLSSGASVKTTQDLLRHSSPMMTLGVYAKAVTADKRAAQEAIVTMMRGKGDEELVASE
jgi:hypothetical protein